MPYTTAVNTEAQALQRRHFATLDNNILILMSQEPKRYCEILFHTIIAYALYVNGISLRSLTCQ